MAYYKITKAVPFPQGGKYCFLYETEVRQLRDATALQRYYKHHNIKVNIEQI